MIVLLDFDFNFISPLNFLERFLRLANLNDNEFLLDKCIEVL